MKGFVVIGMIVVARSALCVAPASASVHKLIALWKDESWIVTSDDTFRHVGIPGRLLASGESGQVALLCLPESGSASSDDELQFRRVEALIALKNIGIRKLANANVFANIEMALLYDRNTDRKLFKRAMHFFAGWSRHPKYGAIAQYFLKYDL